MGFFSFLKKTSQNATASATPIATIEDKFIESLQPEPKMYSVDTLPPFLSYAGQYGYANNEATQWDGEKFFGGYGNTQVQAPDYWTLRARSAELFNSNLYARGLIRRLITNEINTGLAPEACPDEQILGLPEDSLNDWTELAENRFGIWAKNPQLCDYYGRDTFGELQRKARRTALVSGDVLVVLRFNQRTKLPSVQLIAGNKVQQPFENATIREGHDVLHGVERDAQGKDAAYWIRQDDGSFKRLPAFGEKSGRRLAWLVYGTDKLMDERRGQPLLAIVLQSTKELDRYRDSAQRKAAINSLVAMFIKKTENKMSTMPISGGAKRRDTVETVDATGVPRTFKINQINPGMVIEELQMGEEPVPMNSQGTDVDFGKFEEVIVAALAWCNEIPPEILTLAFSNNYSASQAAINEFKIYLNRIWSEFGEQFCGPIYVEHLISELLINKNSAPGLIDAWRDPMKYDIFGAWVAADWYGSIKPSTDMLKQVKGSALLIEHGLSTHAREARITTGTKFSKNVKRNKRENELLVEARRPMAEFEKEYSVKPAAEAAGGISSITNDEILDAIHEIGAVK